MVPLIPGLLHRGDTCGWGRTRTIYPYQNRGEQSKNRLENSWRLSRLKGLGPEHTSFLFKLVHRLLVTRERQHRTNSAASPNCRAQGCQEAVENLEHALFYCPTNNNVGKSVLHILREHHRHITAEAVLRLELVIAPDH